MQRAFPVAVMRGGSSRALVFRAEDLPAEIELQDRVFMAALGCPDPTGRQVDGLGGGASSNNTVAIVAPSDNPGADVDYTFCQLSPDHNAVDRAGNCGNISAAIGPFAIETGIVVPEDGVTTVTIRNTNSGRRLVAHVPTPNRRFDPHGSFAIGGVPGTGARISLDFVEPSGSAGRGELPSGRPAESLAGPDFGTVRCSLVDAGKPCVLVPFSEMGLNQDVRPEELDANPSMLSRIEALRGAGAVAMGLAADSAATTPSLPQLAFFAPADRGALRVLGISMGRAHRSLPLTAAICLGAASGISGTLVAGALGSWSGGEKPLTLVHPAGRIEVSPSFAKGKDGPRLDRVSVARTARRLFEGAVYVEI
ncbi:MAG: PrpF domain-containing protein [Solirubrobacterales bacterium]